MPRTRIIAALLAGRTEEFLAREEVRRLAADFRKGIDRALSRSSSEDGAAFLARVRRGLEEHKEAERVLEGEFTLLGQQLAAASAGELSAIHDRFRALVAEHFRRRRGVSPFFELTAAYRDMLVRRVLELAEARMPSPAPPFACVALGAGGRGEPLPASGEEGVLVCSEGELPYFSSFGGHVRLLLDEAGLGAGPPLPAASVAEWRSRIASCLHSGECGGIGDPADLADARLVAGDAVLGEAFIAAAREGLSLNRPLLRRVAKEAAMLPLAIRFLGWFRVERGGAHRGEINLRQYAIEPLVSNIRLMALMNGAQETGTVQRVRGLLHRGKLDVSLAERLLKAYLDFCGFQIETLVKAVPGGVEDAGFLSPDYLTEEEEQVLREGLETVETLQKIMYTEYVGHG
ncbi:MAG TPA: putative nucleotidyltransferase substrate binding domain-containing protein [Verrucomicrobiae bacterium]|nr:putative nucleotidyltransferase substrate binding domain-containing protein [Verrucomicrobiae bacterium]